MPRSETSVDRADAIEVRARRGAFSECAPAERAINALLRDNRALTAMLDRIARVDGVEFDPAQEECIADGVEGLADVYHEAVAGLTVAQGDARVLAHAYEHDTRPPADVVARALANRAGR